MSVHGGPLTESWAAGWPSERAPLARPTLLAPGLLEEEARFYHRYRWALNPFPTVDELRRRLREELRAWPTTPDDWRRHEVLTNVFLLACALANVADDFLAGDGYDLSRVAAVLPGAGRLTRAADGALRALRSLRYARFQGLRRWRRDWDAALHVFAVSSIAASKVAPVELAVTAARLAGLLERPLPRALAARRIGIPAAFRSQDLAIDDIHELALRFADDDSFPDRQRPLLV